MDQGASEASSGQTTGDMSTDIRLSGALQLGELDGIQLGYANVTRRFDNTDRYTSPNVVFRHVYPLVGFWGAWEAAATAPGDYPTSNTWGDATDTTVTNKGDTLYHFTRMPAHFESEIWPVIEDIFESGTGQRTTVSLSDFVRIVAMTTRVFASLYQRMVYNHLAYHFDWRVVFPFTDSVPAHLFSACDNLKCTDTQIVEVWLRYMKRLEAIPLFPGIIQEVKRAMTPYLTADVHPRVVVPTLGTVYAADATHQSQLQGVMMWKSALDDEAGIADKLDFVLNTLGEELAVMKSFLPLAGERQALWGVNPIQIDLDRETGHYNSGINERFILQDTNDPDPDHDLQYWTEGSSSPSGTDEPLTIKFLTRGKAPTFAEIRQASINRFWSGTTDDSYALDSPHYVGCVQLVSTKRDPSDAINVDTLFLGNSIPTSINTDTPFRRWQDFANSRFAYSAPLDSTDPRASYEDALQGIPKMGMLWSDVSPDAYHPALDQFTEQLFSFSALRFMSANMQGATIRQLRRDMVIAMNRLA